MPPAIRRAVAVLWLAGAVIAGLTSVIATTRDVSTAPVFAVAAAALIVLAFATYRGLRWALVVSLVLLGLQLFGVVGSAWELASGVDGRKAGQLRDLGFDPRFGVTLNLVYSAVAFSLFLWAMSQRGQADT